jgi:RNA polymerase sigma-70 factor (ECF subfamily)
LGQPRSRVAKRLRISPNNLGVRLHRARRALRGALMRFCSTCPTHGFLNCACEQAPASVAERTGGRSTAVVGRRAKRLKSGRVARGFL